MGRTSIPEYQPTRPRLAFYPRTAYFKRARVDEELKRMIAAAGGRDNVDSVYLRGEEALAEHERRNGYNLAFGPGGVALTMADQFEKVFPTEEKQRPGILAQ